MGEIIIWQLSTGQTLKRYDLKQAIYDLCLMHIEDDSSVINLNITSPKLNASSSSKLKSSTTSSEKEELAPGFFIPKDLTFAIGSRKTLDIVSVAKETIIQCLPGHKNPFVNCLKRVDHYLISSSAGGSITIYDMLTLKKSDQPILQLDAGGTFFFTLFIF